VPLSVGKRGYFLKEKGRVAVSTGTNNFDFVSVLTEVRCWYLKHISSSRESGVSKE